MELVGQVVKKAFGGASKSARLAIVLVTQQGEYVLRRSGGNAFEDAELEQLVGCSIRAEGTVHGYTFLVTHWQLLS